MYILFVCLYLFVLQGLFLFIDLVWLHSLSFEEICRHLSNPTVDLSSTGWWRCWCCPRSQKGPWRTLSSSTSPMSTLLSWWCENCWVKRTVAEGRRESCDACLFFQKPQHQSKMKTFRFGSGSVLMNLYVEHGGYKQGNKVFGLFPVIIVERLILHPRAVHLNGVRSHRSGSHGHACSQQPLEPGSEAVVHSVRSHDLQGRHEDKRM